MMAVLMRAATILCVLASLSLATATAGAATLPPIKHVWIVVLENKSYPTTFGDGSQAPYLAKTLTSQGQLLTQYYGTGHNSLDNYITMVSGQPPDQDTQGDCQTYTDFAGAVGGDGVAVGNGCVYPTAVKTIGDQLEAKGLTWRQYAEDMASSSTEPKTCRHPPLNQADQSEGAKATDQFATKHTPFVYFHSIIDRQAFCDTNVVDLSALPGDLASASTTPSYSLITPDLCSDGHDTPCVDGRPGGLQSVNDFLQTWIPQITGSPAYADGGLLIITFDEASGDATDCCGEPMSPNTPSNGGSGNGGGRVGAVLLSRYIKAGGVNDTPYNHYSLLRSTEDLFGLSHLAYAANDGLKPFAEDVFTQPTGVPEMTPTPMPMPTPTPPPAPDPNGPKPSVTVTHVPAGCAPLSYVALIRVTSKQLQGVRVLVDGRRIATRAKRVFSLKVSTKKLHRGTHHLVARATDKLGRQGAKSVAFRTCR
jgi:hypothetical protein